jgi:Protein of unknown function (DUF3089)
MMRATPLFLLVLFSISACAPAWQKKVSGYKITAPDGIPDYSNIYFWAAHPGKWDPSDSIPAPLRNIPAVEKKVDVFFIHPTTLLKDREKYGWNADINNNKLNAQTDYTAILFQASVFNESCRVFAPRYRQAHLDAFFTKDTVAAVNAFSMAYTDVKKAFEFYLAHENKGRPIIIASHSQGTLHAGQLLKDFFEKKSLRQQLVAAYIIGMPLPKNYFSVLVPCSDEKQTGCFVGWRTLHTGFLTDYMQQEPDNSSFVTNPLTWKMNDTLASSSLNKGGVLLKFNRVDKKVCNARINNNVLWASKPRFPFSFLIGMQNYHVADINLFYMNIRENVKLRVDEFFKKGGGLPE